MNKRASDDERLREAEQQIEFVSFVSHEMRNPLTTARTAVTCLRDGVAGPMTPRQMKFVDMLSRSVDRQIKIMDNVLGLTRLQSGKARIDARPFDLFAAACGIAEEFSVSGASCHLELALPEELPRVAGDPDMIGQVLRNLIDNASRYAKSAVVVAASASEREVTVSVRDDGQGMDRRAMSALFTKYAQFGRPAGGGAYRGSGLGLAICKEIVSAHGGRIWARSAPGLGSEFLFTVPRSGVGAPSVTSCS